MAPALRMAPRPPWGLAQADFVLFLTDHAHVPRNDARYAAEGAVTFVISDDWSSDDTEAN
jgi:hypothetical protein